MKWEKISQTYITDEFFSGWIDTLKELSTCGINKLSINEELIGELKLHVVGLHFDGIILKHRLGITTSHFHDHNLQKKNISQYSITINHEIY